MSVVKDSRVKRDRHLTTRSLLAVARLLTREKYARYLTTQMAIGDLCNFRNT